MDETIEQATSTTSPSPQPDVVARVRQHQQLAWQNGKFVLVEQLLSEHASDALLSDDQRLELILAEWLLAKSVGQPTDVEAYKRRFPDLAPRLSSLFSLASAIDHTDLDKTTSMPELTNVGANTVARTPMFAATPADKSLQAGMTIGKYQLRERLGQGGMGAVYLASHTLIDHQVAIKVMLPHLVQHSNSQSRFLKEAQLCVSLEHPNLVRTFNIDQDGPYLFMTMELLKGKNLAEYVATHGPLASHDVYEVISQAAEGLAHAHRKGIVHRDIKPHNIMRVSDGAVKVLDLGLATLNSDLQDWTSETGAEAATLDDRLTATGSVMGTVAYMAPEQAHSPRNAGVRSDIFSLGCTAYFLLTGESLSGQATPIEILKVKLSRDDWPHLSLELLPAPWQKLLPRMIAWKPENRFESMQMVLEELDRVFGGGEIWMPDPRDTETLRSKLLKYDLITEVQWLQSLMRMVDNSRSFSTMAFTPDLTSSPTPAFELLLKMSEPTTDDKPCLTKFQVQQIMAGHLTSLRLPDHVVSESLSNGWKREVFLCRRVDNARIETVRMIGQQALLGLGSTAPEQFSASTGAIEKLQAIDHQGIGKVYGGSWCNERLLISAEYVPGKVLSSEVRARSGYQNTEDWKIVLESALAMASGVAYLHARGILHLDLSTERWIREPGGSLRLLDAGIASLLLPKKWDDIPRSSGMPPVIAPEMMGDLTAASPAADVFALGHVFRFLRTGVFPFKSMKLSDLPSPASRRRSNYRSGASLDHASLSKRRARSESMPPTAARFDWQVEFDQLTTQMTLPDIEQRIASAEAVALRLETLLGIQLVFAKSPDKRPSKSIVSRLRGIIGR